MAGLACSLISAAVMAAETDPIVGQTFYPAEYRAMKNPLPFNQETIALGRKVFTDQQCISCHGVRGDGKGDAAKVGRFMPKPRDFTDARAMSKKTDGMLFYSISKGVHGTWMLPREKLLSEKDRWAVVHYIRTFAGAAEPKNKAEKKESK